MPLRLAAARLAVTLVVATLVGCSATADPPSTATSPLTDRPLAWTAQPLPAGVAPVTVTAFDDGLLVSGYAVARPHPRLFVLRDGTAQEVRVAPSSPYAFEARWLSVAVHGERIVAVGGARGGAHGNYRWTVWDGTRAGLVEQPQPFGVFGGWGAGDLTGIAFAGELPVVSGAWASDSTGNDVALWRQTGRRWARQPSTTTALASTPSMLMGARHLTSTGPGLALSGSVTDLAEGRVASVAALWTSPDADGPWTLVRLPVTSTLADAHGARCDVRRCLVVGQDGGVLAGWEVVDGRATRVEVPPITVPEDVTLMAPVRLGADVLVVPGRVLVRSPTGWDPRPGPSGVPTSVTAAGGVLHVVTTDSSGMTHVWSARP